MIGVLGHDSVHFLRCFLIVLNDFSVIYTDILSEVKYIYIYQSVIFGNVFAIWKSELPSSSLFLGVDRRRVFKKSFSKLSMLPICHQNA